MTLNQAIEYVKDQARKYGYSEKQLYMLIPDLREMLYELPSTSNEDIDKFIEEHL